MLTHNVEIPQHQEAGHYNVVFTGEILPGFNELKVKQDLCVLFKVDPHSFKGKRIFENDTVIMKAEVGIEEAERYKASITEIGAACIVEPSDKENKEQDSDEVSNPHTGIQETRKDKTPVRYNRRYNIKVLVSILVAIGIFTVLLIYVANTINAQYKVVYDYKASYNARWWFSLMLFIILFIAALILKKRNSIPDGLILLILFIALTLLRFSGVRELKRATGHLSYAI
ncbi:MAG: hypothetical protein HQL03_13205, partial [Nitrospirae bacterium]|nr:hypothetical protein [Nitrospirota bacterium]